MSSSRYDLDYLSAGDGSDRRSNDDDADVSDAQYMLEALHGSEAPMLAVAIACDRLLDGKTKDTKFWMRVYRALIADSGVDRLKPRVLH